MNRSDAQYFEFIKMSIASLIFIKAIYLIPMRPNKKKDGGRIKRGRKEQRRTKKKKERERETE